MRQAAQTRTMELARAQAEQAARAAEAAENTSVQDGSSQENP
jgi:hypothetical protein